MTSWKSKRRIMRSYDATSSSYDEQYSGEQKAKYHKALENVNVAGKVVLDVGCGSGLFFSHVADKAQTVVGVDVSHKLLVEAKKQAGDSPNVFVLQADADHLPIKEGFFDAAFAFTVLQNIPKPKETLKELERVSKPHGSVVVTGLKKAFPLDKFMDLLESSGMQIAAFVDEEEVNCYVAVLVA